jgi:hypothetical protein
MYLPTEQKLELWIDRLMETLTQTKLLCRDPALFVQFLDAASAIYIKPDMTDYSICLSFEPGCSVAIIKKDSEIVDTVPLHLQLLVINLPSDPNILNYLNFGFAPLVTTAQSKKKLAELNLLLQPALMQIPRVKLEIHPEISKCCELAAAQNIKPNLDLIGPLANDQSFLNTIQGHVNLWIKEIQKVTLLSTDITGSAKQEVEFWINMESSLLHIDSLLKSNPINLVLDILRNAKRFHATVSFLADTGINEALDKVSKYNQLMKDFPIHVLLSTSELDKIPDALLLIFNHLNKKLRISPYPISRALGLVEAISRDLNALLLNLTRHTKLLVIDYQSFERLINNFNLIFKAWDEQAKEFVSVAREVTRKRSDRFVPIKIHAVHCLLQERIQFVSHFRSLHEKLVFTLHQTLKQKSAMLGIDGESALLQVENSLALIKEIDLFDVSQGFVL